MKTCSACKIELPFSNFHKNRAQQDGYANQCKECSKASVKKYYDSELGQKTKNSYRKSKIGKESLRRGRIKYEKSDKGKATKKRFRQTEKGKALSIRATRRFAVRHPQKLRVYWAVASKIKSGKMPPASTLICNSCGGAATQYHHHNGYAREHYYDVTPLCTQCHKNEHAQEIIGSPELLG